MEQYTDNSDSKNISYKLPTLGVLTMIFFGIALIMMKQPEHRYKKTTDDMMNVLLEKKNIISYEKFKEIYSSKDSKYQFIDLRSAHEFLKGHLEGAINIPYNKLLEKEYENIFNQDKKTNILYYSDQSGTSGPWMILEQLGYKNNLILQGGYDLVSLSFTDTIAKTDADFMQETAKYDFKAIIEANKDTTSTASAETVKTGTENTTNTAVKPKKAKKSGGC